MYLLIYSREYLFNYLLFAYDLKVMNVKMCVQGRNIWLRRLKHSIKWGCNTLVRRRRLFFICLSALYLCIYCFIHVIFKNNSQCNILLFGYFSSLPLWNERMLDRRLLQWNTTGCFASVERRSWRAVSTCPINLISHPFHIGEGGK